MEKERVFRRVFFTKSEEYVSEVKRIKKDFENVRIEKCSATTNEEGSIGIAIVYYDTPQKCDLFSDEEWENLYGKI